MCAWVCKCAGNRFLFEGASYFWIAKRPRFAFPSQPIGILFLLFSQHTSRPGASYPRSSLAVCQCYRWLISAFWDCGSPSWFFVLVAWMLNRMSMGQNVTFSTRMHWEPVLVWRSFPFFNHRVFAFRFFVHFQGDYTFRELLRLNANSDDPKLKAKGANWHINFVVFVATVQSPIFLKRNCSFSCTWVL